MEEDRQKEGSVHCREFPGLGEHPPAALRPRIYLNSHKPGVSEASGKDRVSCLQVTPG